MFEDTIGLAAVNLKELKYKVKNTIKEFRKWQGISQSDLALLCNISEDTVTAIENNEYDPGLQLAFDMAKYLNVRIDELFINEENYEN